MTMKQVLFGMAVVLVIMLTIFVFGPMLSGRTAVSSLDEHGLLTAQEAFSDDAIVPFVNYRKVLPEGATDWKIEYNYAVVQKNENYNNAIAYNIVSKTYWCEFGEGNWITCEITEEPVE